MRKVFLTVTFAAALFGLAACSKGVDRALVTDKGVDAYNASIAQAAHDIEPQEGEAFDWAVSDLTLEKLNATYPNASMRTVIRGEVKAVLNDYPARIAQLEKQAHDWNAAAAPIRDVVAQDVSFALERDFHGLQPTILVTVRNGSPLGFSTLKWHAGLYLDGGPEPVATAELTDIYKDDGGLPPGATARRSFRVGFVTGDAAWTTLEVQNAKRREVRLIVEPEGAEDFGERLIVGKSPLPQLQSLKAALEVAQKFKDI